MKFIIGIPFVVGLDFTQKALQSIRPYWEHTYVIDSSVPPDPPASSIWQQGDSWTLMRLLIPIGMAQSVNLIMALGEKHGCDVMFYMHNDAEAGEGTVERLLELAAQYIRVNRKWAVLFTSYDALCCYNMACVRDVGPWDARLFPFPYYGDNDWHRRVQLAGWELIDTGLPCAHFGSHSLKINPQYKFLNQITFDNQCDIYKKKWGGHPGQETFTKPFNGVIEYQ